MKDEKRGHVSNDALAGFIDGRLQGRERAEVEAHLLVCPACRGDFVAAKAAIRQKPRRRWIPMAAAAMLALAVATILGRSNPAPANVVRSSETDGGRLTQPPTGATVSADSVVFVWGAAAGSASYRLVVTDSIGRPAVQRDSRDTTAAVKLGADLQPGTYFWFVDVLFDDGRSVTSALRMLRVE